MTLSFSDMASSSFFCVIVMMRMIDNRCFHDCFPFSLFVELQHKGIVIDIKIGDFPTAFGFLFLFVTRTTIDETRMNRIFIA